MISPNKIPATLVILTLLFGASELSAQILIEGFGIAPNSWNAEQNAISHWDAQAQASVCVPDSWYNATSRQLVCDDLGFKFVCEASGVTFCASVDTFIEGFGHAPASWDAEQNAIANWNANAVGRNCDIASWYQASAKTLECDDLGFKFVCEASGIAPCPPQ